MSQRDPQWECPECREYDNRPYVEALRLAESHARDIERLSSDFADAEAEVDRYREALEPARQLHAAAQRVVDEFTTTNDPEVYEVPEDAISALSAACFGFFAVAGGDPE